MKRAYSRKPKQYKEKRYGTVLTYNFGRMWKECSKVQYTVLVTSEG